MLNKRDIADEKKSIDEKKYSSCNNIDFSDLDVPGVYCIRLKVPYKGKFSKKDNKFFKPFIRILEKRKNNILYIGIATKSLKQRLNQELKAKGHGTFFRSLGAILNYKPVEDSLVKTKREYNYKFSDKNEEKIINWINEYLIVKWIEKSDSLAKFERYLIEDKDYKPVVNIKNNPLALKEIKALRKECVDFANKKCSS